MRVGYDEQVFLAQPRGGISRYFVSLIERFRAEEILHITPVPGFTVTANRHVAEAKLAASSPTIARLGPLAMPGYYLANTPARRRAQRTDVLHHTYYHPRFRAEHSAARHVTTVHDMIPELYPDSFTGPSPHLAKRAYVDSSDLVICVSHSAYTDLVEVYGQPKAPVRVIHHGVDPQFSPNQAEPAGAPGRYLLFVGRRDGYKDFDVLVGAFAALADKNVLLVAVGGGQFTDREVALQERWGVAARIRQTDASDMELRRLYAHAISFVFPSRHEGFGLPTLEAMASGTPVVLADTSSHPEAGGDVARYFPPRDEEKLAAALSELLEDSALRAELGGQGVVRALGFTWSATARATADAYRSVCDPAR